MEMIRFVLNGCDISFEAKAPADITLKQLLVQCDRIVPDYCACGICTSDTKDDRWLDMIITYDDIEVVTKYPSFKIKPKKMAELEKIISWRDK